MQIKTFQPTDHKIKALIYGASGSGKTVFGGTAPNPIFASAEGGLLSIADKHVPFVEIRSLTDLSELLDYLKNEKHNYETIIIDSISEINDIIKQEIEKKTGKPMQLQDWGTLSKKIKAIFRSFRDLPMHVLFIAQEMNEKDEDKIDKIVPSLNGKASTEISYFMDIVGYIFVEKTGNRKIITSANAKLLSKDRSNKIGNDIDVDFSVWVEKVKGVKLGEQEVVADVKKKETIEPVMISSSVAEKYEGKEKEETFQCIDCGKQISESIYNFKGLKKCLQCQNSKIQETISENINDIVNSVKDEPYDGQNTGPLPF